MLFMGREKGAGDLVSGNERLTVHVPGEACPQRPSQFQRFYFFNFFYVDVLISVF